MVHGPGEPALGFLLCPRRMLAVNLKIPVFADVGTLSALVFPKHCNTWILCVCANFKMKLEMVSFHGDAEWKCWSLERT